MTDLEIYELFAELFPQAKWKEDPFKVAKALAKFRATYDGQEEKMLRLLAKHQHEVVKGTKVDQIKGMTVLGWDWAFNKAMKLEEVGSPPQPKPVPGVFPAGENKLLLLLEQLVQDISAIKEVITQKGLG